MTKFYQSEYPFNFFMNVLFLLIKIQLIKKFIYLFFLIIIKLHLSLESWWRCKLPWIIFLTLSIWEKKWKKKMFFRFLAFPWKWTFFPWHMRESEITCCNRLWDNSFSYSRFFFFTFSSSSVKMKRFLLGSLSVSLVYTLYRKSHSPRHNARSSSRINLLGRDIEKKKKIRAVCGNA